MNRRKLLSMLGAVVVVPGCLNSSPRDLGGATGPIFELQMSAVNNTEIARKQIDSVSEYPPSWSRAIQEGNATYTARGRGSISEDVLLRMDGHVYNLSLSELDGGATENHHYTIEFKSASSSEPAQSIGYDELPAVDQEALADVGLSKPEADQSFGIGVTLSYNESERVASTLVPSSEGKVIQWPSGASAKIDVIDSSTRDAVRYHISATAIGSLSEYGRKFRRQASFNFNDLSEGERTIINKAISREDGFSIHTEERTTQALPPGAKQLQERFSAHSDETFERNSRFNDATGRFCLIDFNNSTYWTQFATKMDANN